MDTPLSERPLGLRDEINGRRRRSAAGKRNTKKGGDNSPPFQQTIKQALP